MDGNNNSIIYFYDIESELVKKEHIFLNNFDPSPIVDDQGLTYDTVEHYYQAHKFNDFSKGDNFKQAFEEIRTADTPLKCKKLARHYEQEFKDIWNKEEWNGGRKETVMMKGLIYKFQQNPALLNRLMETGDSVLVEASDKDPYWGGLLPESKNRLGLQLMELREKYRKENSLIC